MRKLIFSLVFVVFLAQTGLCIDSLDLEKAKSLALRKNPALVAEAYRIKAAESGVKEARSRFFPRVDIHLIYQRSDSPIQVFMAKLAQQDFKASDFQIDPLNHPDPRTNLQTAVEITQPIFNQGQEILGYQAAKRQAERAALEREALRQYVLYQVEAAYTSWLLARQQVSVLQKAVDTAQANLKMVSARVKNGTALTSDLLQARVHLATLKRELLAAKNQAQVALSRLNLLMGVPTDTPWQPATDVLDFSPTKRPLAYWQDLALKRRPDLAAMREEVRLARLAVKKAKFRFLPAVNLKGRYEYNSEGIGGVSGDAFTVWAQADFNLFRGFGDKARLSRARAEELAAEAHLRQQENQVRQEVEEAYLALQTAAAQVQVTKAAVAQAQEGLALVRKRYQNGLTTIVELLGAETALKRAALEALTARYQWRLAWTELLFRAGVLQK